ncbi:hypothetical protein EC973_003818 [Apophysomyces ossiformis]|uniref:Uncharacterized protein n=1 Tax=Apophysomyces ossiformis TaxID=679940 RepID=A0A8H7BSU7_9FUNG|nr:hypothetical protein EC973_003818 [Apophysomyces ossiformis]
MSRPKRARSFSEQLDDDFQIKRSKIQEPLQTLQQVLPSPPPAAPPPAAAPAPFTPPTDVLKSFTISTRTPYNPYSNINDMLHHLHIQRYGDAQTNCDRWNNTQVQEENEAYNTMNAVLRDAFLQRHRAPPPPPPPPS